MLYGRQYGRLGDFVEHDAAGLLLVEPQHLAQMPRYGLSLAVFIGRQPHLLGLLGLLPQLRDEFFLLVWYLVFRLQRRVVDAQLLFLQVAYVAVARHHLEVLSQELLYGLGLGRRLYND